MISINKIEMFNLIPYEKLDYESLLLVKESKDRVIEEEFLNKIDATELERLVVSGKVEEIKGKNYEWLSENYKFGRGDTCNKRVSTAEILCAYREELIEELVEKIKVCKKDIGDHILFIASKLGKERLVNCLISEGIGVRETLNEAGWAALKVAAKRGYVGMCELLLKKREKDRKWEVFMAAAINGHREVCEMLLNEGIDLSEYGAALFKMVSQNGHIEVCNLLLDKGVKLGDSTNTTLIFVAKKGYKGVCELLLDRGVGVDVLDESGNRAIVCAAENGHSDVCELLIERGAEVNAISDEEIKSGRLPLALAAENGHKDVCELLLEKGAEINCTIVSLDVEWESPETPLMRAAKNGHKETCQLLLDKNIYEVVSLNNYGWKALKLAAENGHRDVCELLLEYESELKSGEFGYCMSDVLMNAAYSGQKKICELFLSKGASLDIDELAKLPPNVNRDSLLEAFINFGVEIEHSSLKDRVISIKLRECRDSILSKETTNLNRIIEKKILKGENVIEILEDVRQKRKGRGLNDSWLSVVDELVNNLTTEKCSDFREQVVNEELEKLLIRNYLIRALKENNLFPSS